MPSRFATDTAATPLGAGRYTARVDPGWWIERGPNGGYVAALILRAVTAEVADPDRQLRSFTVHYLAPPA
ncbi:MAG: acyl-CoA thioesterase domain-containing protein, partial [Acidimicrobiales bacterium]